MTAIPRHASNQLVSIMAYFRARSALLAAAALLWSGAAFAGSVTLSLPTSTETEVDDAAGFTLHFTGPIIKGAKSVTVGEFFSTLRNETRPSPVLNSGQVHMTLFFPHRPGSSSTAAENVTIDGDHDFSSGGFKGSVSAASNALNWLVGADVRYATIGTGTDRTLTIVWAGSNELGGLIR